MPMPGTPKTTDIRLRNTLISLINIMKHKAEDNGIVPVITTAKLIDMLRVSGVSITYAQLVELLKDPSISNSISKVNKNQIELKLDTGINDDELQSLESDIENDGNDDFASFGSGDGDVDIDFDAMPDENSQQSDVGFEQLDADGDGFFSSDENYSQQPDNFQQDVQNDQNQQYREGIVSQMAKRAARRND